MYLLCSATTVGLETTVPFRRVSSGLLTTPQLGACHATLSATGFRTGVSAIRPASSASSSSRRLAASSSSAPSHAPVYGVAQAPGPTAPRSSTHNNNKMTGDDGLNHHLSEACQRPMMQGQVHFQRTRRYAHVPLIMCEFHHDSRAKSPRWDG